MTPKQDAKQGAKGPPSAELEERLQKPMLQHFITSLLLEPAAFKDAQKARLLRERDDSREVGKLPGHSPTISAEKLAEVLEAGPQLLTDQELNMLSVRDPETVDIIRAFLLTRENLPDAWLKAVELNQIRAAKGD
jgi:hypothetical protein